MWSLWRIEREKSCMETMIKKRWREYFDKVQHQKSKDVHENGIPLEWRKSKITPLYEQRGDNLTCSDYRRIKLLIHCLKLFEQVIEARIRKKWVRSAVHSMASRMRSRQHSPWFARGTSGKDEGTRKGLTCGLRWPKEWNKARYLETYLGECGTEIAKRID